MTAEEMRSALLFDPATDSRLLELDTEAVMLDNIGMIAMEADEGDAGTGETGDGDTTGTANAATEKVEEKKKKNFKEFLKGLWEGVVRIVNAIGNFIKKTFNSLRTLGMTLKARSAERALGRHLGTGEFEVPTWAKEYLDIANKQTGNEVAKATIEGHVKDTPENISKFLETEEKKIAEDFKNAAKLKEDANNKSKCTFGDMSKYVKDLQANVSKLYGHANELKKEMGKVDGMSKQEAHNVRLLAAKLTSFKIKYARTGFQGVAAIVRAANAVKVSADERKAVGTANKAARDAARAAKKK